MALLAGIAAGVGGCVRVRSSGLREQSGRPNGHQGKDYSPAPDPTSHVNPRHLRPGIARAKPTGPARPKVPEINTRDVTPELVGRLLCYPEVAAARNL